jgi:hypothetical protein
MGTAGVGDLLAIHATPCPPRHFDLPQDPANDGTQRRECEGEIGPDLFRAACDMGLEGLVSKHRDRPYQAGRSKHWVKIKNRKHPAMARVMEASR